MKRELKPQNEKMAQLFNPLIGDIQFLANDVFFGRLQRRDATQKDAAELLNSRLNWGLGQGKRRIPVEIEQQLEAWKEEWPLRFQDLEISYMDTSWMNELQKYSFWDLEGPGSPLTSFVRKAKGTDVFISYPLPMFSDLVLIAITHLVSELRAKRPENGLKNARKLAALVYSTETLAGLAAAADILREERRFWNFMKERFQKWTDQNPWKPVQENTLRRANRAAWLMPKYFHFLRDTEIARQVFDPVTLTVCGCASLRESLQSMLLSKGYFDKSGFLELDYSHQLEKMNRILDATAPLCRLRLVREAWRGDGDWRNRLYSNQKFQSMPILRRMMGISVSPVAIPGSFQHYE